MTRNIVIITPNGTEFAANAADALVADLNQQFGSVPKARCISGDMTAKPALLKAVLENSTRAKDSETYLVLVRDDEQVYVSPNLMDNVLEALTHEQQSDATSWDILDRVIPKQPR